MDDKQRFRGRGLRITLGLLALVQASARAQECVPAPEGLVAWWPGDGTATDIEGGNDGVLEGGVGFGAGLVDQAFQCDGMDDVVRVPSPTGLPLGNSARTVDFWAKFNSFQANDFQVLFFYGMKSATVEDASLSLTHGWGMGISRTTHELYVSQIGLAVTGNVPPLGQWIHVAATYDGSTYRLYENGVLTGSGSMPTDTLAGELNICNQLHFFPSGCGLNGQCPFDGLIDEVEIFDRALSATEIQAIVDAGIAGKCKDEDGDGFRPPDDCDEGDPLVHPASIELPGNFVDENCDGSLGDVDPCAEWQNHGKYVRAVAHAVGDLVDAGLISEAEGDALVSSAAMSQIGKTGFVPPECL